MSSKGEATGRMEYNWQRYKKNKLCICRRVFLPLSLSINTQNREINVSYNVFVFDVVVVLLSLSYWLSFNFQSLVKMCWFYHLIYIIVTKSIIFQFDSIKSSDDCHVECSTWYFFLLPLCVHCASVWNRIYFQRFDFHGCRRTLLFLSLSMTMLYMLPFLSL